MSLPQLVLVLFSITSFGGCIIYVAWIVQCIGKDLDELYERVGKIESKL